MTIANDQYFLCLKFCKGKIFTLNGRLLIQAKVSQTHYVNPHCQGLASNCYIATLITFVIRDGMF